MQNGGNILLQCQMKRKKLSGKRREKIIPNGLQSQIRQKRSQEKKARVNKAKQRAAMSDETKEVEKTRGESILQNDVVLCQIRQKRLRK